MKKVLSFVLALCLICTLLPATALTANAVDETVTYTFKNYTVGTQYANGEVHKLDDRVTVTTYECHFTTELRIYSSSQHNGYAVIQSTQPITAITLNASYKKDTVNIYGSDDGETWSTSTIGTITTTTTSSKDYSTTFSTGYKYLKLDVKGSNQIRIQYMKLTFSASDEPECEHKNVTTTVTKDPSCTETGTEAWECDDCGATGTNTLEKVLHSLVDAEGYPATCTEPGLEAGQVCENCDYTTQKPIPADHKYVNGTCSVCGQAKPKGYIETEASKLDGTQVVVVTMTNGSATYALTNGGGTGSAPQATPVTVTDGMIAAEDVADNLKWNVTYSSNGDITIYPNGTTATWLYCNSANNGVRVGTNENKVFTISGNYLKHSGTDRYVGIYSSQDWRCYTSTSTNIGGQTLKFYVLDEGGTPDVPDCEHTETVEFGAVAATCTTPGKQAGVKCADPDCGHVITEPTDIPALGHNYVDGECAVCHAPDPFINLPGRYYIAAFRNSESKNYYLTSTLTSTSTKRYTAVAVTGALPTAITNPKAGYVFAVVKNSDGTYSIQAEGVEGNNYLGWTSGNSGALQAADADTTKLIPVDNGNGTYSFGIKDTERVLALNEVTGNNYFAWYAGTQVTSLKLIPVIAPIQYTDGSVTKEYYSWDEELNNLTSGTITLLGNVTAGEIDLDSNVILDLNGMTLTADAVVATVKDSADGAGFIATAQLDSIPTAVAGQVALWDNNAEGYRVFNCEFKTYKAVSGENDDTTMAQTFWSDLEFTNDAAYLYLPTAGLKIGYKLSTLENPVADADFKFYEMNDETILAWADAENGNKNNEDWGFYIRVSGFEALSEDVTVTCVPYIVINGMTTYANAVTYKHTAG